MDATPQAGQAPRRPGVCGLKALSRLAQQTALYGSTARRSLVHGIRPDLLARIPRSPEPLTQLLTDLRALSLSLEGEQGHPALAEWCRNGARWLGAVPAAAALEEAATLFERTRLGETLERPALAWIPPRLPVLDIGDGDSPKRGLEVSGVPKSLLMSISPITRTQFRRVVDPALVHTGVVDERPVVDVTWLGAIRYCNLLSCAEGLPPAYDDEGRNVADFPREGYRLPTSLEWEHACCSGRPPSVLQKEHTTALGTFSWYRANSKGLPRVAARRSDEWGLHDMRGLVWEWTESPPPNCRHVGPGMSNRIAAQRIIRGGSYRDEASTVRSLTWIGRNTQFGHPTLGFRIVRSPG